MDEDIIKLKRKRKVRNIAIFLIIVIVIGGLIAYSIMQKKKQSKLTYDTDKLERGKIEAVVSSTGSLSAVTTVDVGSEVSGKIMTIYVDYNDRVTTGQILAKIDPATYETQLEQAQAGMNSYQAQLNQTRAERDSAMISVYNAMAGIHKAEAGVATSQANLQSSKGSYLSAKANLDKAKAQLDNSLAEYKRSKELFKRELISLSENESSEMQYKVAIASYESAKANVESSKAEIKAAESNVSAAISSLEAARTQKETAEIQIRTANARIASAQAEIDRARAQIGQVKVNLSKCIIRSPIDGIVIDRKVDEGQTVAASYQTPVLFSLARNLGKMEVKAAVDEADIGKVKQRQDVSFTVDAFPDETFTGKVQQVRTSPNINQNVVTYDVIVRTENKDFKLKPGMTANINITVETKNNVLKIPNAAIRFRPDKIANFPFPEDVKKEMEEKGSGKKSNGNGGAGKTSGDTAKKGKRDKSIKGEKPKKDQDKLKLDTAIWILKGDKPERVKIATGISDSSYTEMKDGPLKEGMEVITDASTVGEKEKKGTRSGGIRVRGPH